MKNFFLIIFFSAFFIQCAWDERIGDYDEYIEPSDSIVIKKRIIRGDTTNIDSTKNDSIKKHPITFSATVDDYTDNGINEF